MVIGKRSEWRIGQLTVRDEEDSATIQGPGERRAHTINYVPETLRELVRWDDDGRYRPLSGARTLPHGWRMRCAREQLDEAIEVVYPLAIVHRRQWDAGMLRVASLDDVLGRQTGRYAVAAGLDGGGRQAAREVLCRQCARTPVWGGERIESDAIPCPEPCSVFVSLCREAALWQGAGSPEPRDPEPGVAYAAFDQEGNAIREAYLRARRNAADE